MEKRKLSWRERLQGWVVDDPNNVYELTLTVYPPQRDGGVVLLPQLADREVIAVELLQAQQHDGAPYPVRATYFVTEGQSPGTFGLAVGMGSEGFGIGYHKERSRFTMYEPATTIEHYLVKFYYRNRREVL